MNNENTKNAEKFDFDSLFKELKPLEEIELSLPSKSKFYKGAKVFLRPMTFEDEKAITVGKKNREDILKILLSRCLKGINSKDVVLMDKLYLLMKLREISYQEKYPTVLACQSCAKPNNLIFTLDDLNIKYLEDDAEIEHEIELPKTKVKVKIKHPRLEDEVYLNDELKIVDDLRYFYSYGCMVFNDNNDMVSNTITVMGKIAVSDSQVGGLVQFIMVVMVMVMCW
jgi:hypothetical protein